MNRWIHRIGLGCGTIIFIPLLAGCPDVESCDVRTSGLYADFWVLADGSGDSDVRAQLRVGGRSSLTFLDLDDDPICTDELLTSMNGGAPERMVNVPSVGTERYGRTFGMDAEGTAFSIAFERGPNDVDAPLSEVTMARPFTILSPTANGPPVSRASDLTVEWDLPGTADTVTWEVSGSCLGNASSVAFSGDTGSEVISAGEITARTGEETTTCSATLELRRVRFGSVDPAYGEGGQFFAAHVRRVTFMSTP
ncbi:MAG: hypothetical protein ACFCGT_25340 [Sandaracinaceae bacterium]